MEVEVRLGEMLEQESRIATSAAGCTPTRTCRLRSRGYIERASRLKKHFQEVLFLERRAVPGGRAAAQLGGRFRADPRFDVGLRLAGSAAGAPLAVERDARRIRAIFAHRIVGGLVYAVKDRIKDLGRAWISGNVHRFYAQRVARWRAPARRLPGRDVVVRARESFDTSVVRNPDLLNPESGATTASTIVRYVHRGVVYAKEGLATGVCAA